MEKTELRQVVKLLDKIIGSNSADIKDAFRELLIVATLTETPTDEKGPLETLIFSELDLMRAHLTETNREIAHLRDIMRGGERKGYYDEFAKYARAMPRSYTDPYGGSTATSASKIAWSDLISNKGVK